MTSETRETSWDDGNPVLYFRFTRDTREWFYTSSDRDEEYNGDIYTRADITRSAIRQGSERARMTITLTLPSSLEVAANWRPYPPADPVVLTCFTRHVGETDVLADWTGRVVAPKFKGTLLELVCEPTSTRSRRSGNYRGWQRGCGLPLYGQGLGQCNVDKSLHAVSATLATVAGLTLTATELAALPANRLAGGYIEWVREDGLVEYRSIRSHSGDSISVDYGALDLIPILDITAYPGCKHNWADCDYFNNRPNYGGDLWMPQKSPYDGDPVW